MNNRFLTILLVVATLVMGMTGCKHLDDDRIPPVAVRLSFPTVGDWNYYGISGALSYKYYIYSSTDRVPTDFPYTALSSTGFGGILLCGDILGNYVAYDLSCPVEAKYNIRIEVDRNENIARCPHCGSTYDIFTNYGHPLSGQAADRGYGLRRDYVGPG